MKYINSHHLPEAVFKALSQDSYSAGSSDYSATTLLKPPQMIQLERRYGDQVEVDVIDRVWSLFGQSAHSILEKHSPEESLAEERLYVEFCGKRVGGQVDNYHNRKITDYKITSAWTLVYGSRRAEWEEQLNIYAYLFKENGYPVDSLQIVAILRDWDKNRARQDYNYPQAPIQIVDLNLWDEDKQEEFIKERVQVHSQNEILVDDDLTQCSSEEMWERPATYACMKDGAKKATKVCTTPEEAFDYCSGTNLKVVKREGTRTRCAEYCNVAEYCHQWNSFNNRGV